MPSLFDSLQLGELVLPNRILMAPLTRLRSKQPGDIPQAMNALYYAQRATAGLIISEATQISQQGKGYPGAPGIYTDAQVDGWKKVTHAVHTEGGRIFLQLWHVGRISHSSFQANRAAPVSASAIAAKGKGYKADGSHAEFETPRALETAELSGIVADYRHAAMNAKRAGFDGVEVHGANGYLLQQFMEDSTNQRTDQYGGSVENRCRLTLEVVDAVVKVWGPGRVGIRLSPFGTANDAKDSDPVPLYTYLLGELSKRGIAYVHFVEPRSSGAGAASKEKADNSKPSSADLFRKPFTGVYISNGSYDAKNAPAAVESGQVDAIAFGRWFISNPDLPLRLWKNAPLNAYHRDTFYTQGKEGYTNYPTLAETGGKAVA